MGTRWPDSLIRVCDTTLRDGEQAPGVAFDVATKVRLAQLLDAAGLSEIEAGTPACGDEEAAAVEHVASSGLNARVMAWCRMSPIDIDLASRCGVDGIAIAVPSSDIHIKGKFGRQRDWVVTRMRECIDYAKSRGLYVCAAFEDGSRAEMKFLASLAREAWWEGADRLRFSDTVGQLDPFTTAERVALLDGQTDLPLEFHGHNDFGLATANALAAIRAGATHLSVTALGVGERAGNAALEEVVLGLERLYGRETGIKLDRMQSLFKAVSEATGRPIPPSKPVAGSSAFVHESGIHADGILKDPRTYEPFPPELVGASHRIVLGKHSGTHALAHRLAELGIKASSEQLKMFLPAVRQVCTEGGEAGKDPDLYELWKRAALP